MKYTAKGTFTKNGEAQKYTKDLEARDEKAAREKIYAEFGSKNKLMRKDIKISELKENNAPKVKK